MQQVPGLSTLDNYPREEISAQSKSYISSLDIKKIFFQGVEINAQENEQGESFCDSTMEQALLYTFHRISYQLFYELRKRGEALTMTHLLELLTALENVYSSSVKSEVNFFEVVSWDSSLPIMFESLSNFKIKGNEFVGDDLVEDLALKSIASKESEKSAKLRIKQVVDEVRIAFAKTLPRTEQVQIFVEVIDTHVSNYHEYRNRVSSPETFLNGVIDEVENLCLTAFGSNQEVANGEAKLRALVKTEFTKYNSLIDAYVIELTSLFKTDYDLIVTPTVEGIWIAIVQIVIDNYRSDLDDDPGYLQIPPVKKSGSTLN